MSRALVQGLWKLRSMEQRYDDGRVVYPFGTDVQGYICYSPEGFMCGAIQRANRKPFVTGLQWTANAEEKAKAYDDYLSYCGPYDVIGNDTLVHTMEISLFPNWIGAQQKRTFKITGDTLAITARIEDGTPQARTSYLEFKRTSCL